MRRRNHAIPDGWSIVYHPSPPRRTMKMVSILVYGTDLVECGPPWEIWLCQTERPYKPDEVFLLAERMKNGIKTIWPDWCPIQEPKVRINIWDKEVK